MTSNSTRKLVSLSNKLSAAGTENNTSPQVHWSQRSKTVVLLLYTNGCIAGVIPDRTFVFPVNPDEFSVDRQERVTVTQTLGDPFLDEYGKGLPTLSMHGTTGWRIRPKIDKKDGHESFHRLRRDFIDAFFDERQKKLDAQLDPDDVALIIVNNVDDLCYRIVPKTFKLLRNKTAPLLYQYEMSFVVVESLNSSITRLTHFDDDLPNWPGKKNWIAALADRMNVMLDTLAKASAPVCQTVGAFLTEVAEVLESSKAGVGDIATFIYGISENVELALDAIRDTQCFINNLPLDAIIELNNLTGVISEFNCYLKNGLTDSWLPDFSGIEGLSDCASTHGIPTGAITTSGVNAIEWVTNLTESSSGGGGTAVIGIRHTDGNQPKVFDEPDTAIIMNATLDSKLIALGAFQTSPESAGTLDDAYQAIEDVLGELDIDAARLPAEISEEYLKKITQSKTVVVLLGETLQSIAYREYGTIDRWREIAAANNIAIETARELLAPLTSFVVDINLYQAANTLDVGTPIPSTAAQAGCILVVIDSLNHRQRLTVKSIDGTVITFYETFSQSFTGPITVTRLIDLSGYGLLDSTVFLSAPAASGSRSMSVTETKDIYPGYVLYVVGVLESRAYTVRSVDYLAQTVETVEPLISFPLGARVQIYNRETRQVHVTPGTRLVVPLSKGGKSNLSQSTTEIHGVDIATDGSGALVVQRGGLAVVSGLSNLKQAIEHRILSDYESLPPHPRYGCGLLSVLGDKNTSRMRTFAKATLIDALSREPRLDRITKLDGFSVGDAIKFVVEVAGVDINISTDLNLVAGGADVSN